ncbi:MAG: hypothetical protein JSS79_05255 [Bacteroidetes bacterium]|nr:hypothetical protein [Bacteroidota bacterium]
MAYLELHCEIDITTGESRTVGNTQDGTPIVMRANQNFNFDEVVGIKTSESNENLVNTCEIALAKGLKFRYTTDTGVDVSVTPDLLFQIGDYVSLKMWYTVPIINTSNPAVAQQTNSKPDYTAYFTGYIADVQIGVPIVLRCENEMWALKRNNRLFPDDFLTGRKINNKVVPANPIVKDDGSLGVTLGSVNSYLPKKTSLDDILKVYLYDTTLPIVGDSFDKSNVTTVSVELPGYKSDGAFSLAQIFDDLKDYAGILAYFRGGKIYIGPQSWAIFQKEHLFAFKQNIIDSSSLYFQSAKSVKYRIEVINIKNNVQTKIVNNKYKTKVTNTQTLNNGQLEYFGDAEGEVKKLFVYNYDTTSPDSQSQLEDLAQQELLRYKYDGYAGSFTTFGAPAVYSGDIVTLYDPDAPSRGGQSQSSYLVKAVEREFNADGASYRQKIYIGRRV